MYDNLNDNMLFIYVLILFSRNNMNLKIWLNHGQTQNFKLAGPEYKRKKKIPNRHSYSIKKL